MRSGDFAGEGVPVELEGPVVAEEPEPELVGPSSTSRSCTATSGHGRAPKRRRLSSWRAAAPPDGRRCPHRPRRW